MRCFRNIALDKSIPIVIIPDSATIKDHGRLIYFTTDLKYLIHHKDDLLCTNVDIYAQKKQFTTSICENCNNTSEHELGEIDPPCSNRLSPEGENA